MLCGIDITSENDTEEHIIPNSIGGRKKVKGFICNECNNRTGETWDTEIAKQLNPLSLYFRISRERGNAPSQIFDTTGDSALTLNHDGSLSLSKPSYSESKIDNGVNISIKDRDIKEAKKMLQGVKRKYPNINLEETLEKAESKRSYSNYMIKFNLNFGGHDSVRSIIKSTLALISYSGNDVICCELAIDYLTNKSDNACFGYFYERDLIKNRPEGVPLYCVAIDANSTTGLIICYVEYYGIYRVIGCLSDNYNGNSYNTVYALNPIDGKELNINIDLKISLDEIHAAYRYEKAPNDKRQEAISAIISSQQKEHFDHEQSKLINQGIIKACETLGLKDGDEILPEHSKVIAEEVTKQLQDFIISQFNWKRR